MGRGRAGQGGAGRGGAGQGRAGQGGAGQGGAGQMRLGKKILTSTSAGREEQRHTGPEWVAASCEAPHPGASCADPRTRAQGSNGKTEGLHLKPVGAEGMELWLTALLGLGPKEPKKCSQDCPSTVRFSDFSVIKKFMPTSRKQNGNQSEWSSLQKARLV